MRGAGLGLQWRMVWALTVSAQEGTGAASAGDSQVPPRPALLGPAVAGQPSSGTKFLQAISEVAGHSH